MTALQSGLAAWTDQRPLVIDSGMSGDLLPCFPTMEIITVWLDLMTLNYSPSWTSPLIGHDHWSSLLVGRAESGLLRPRMAGLDFHCPYRQNSSVTVNT